MREKLFFVTFKKLDCGVQTLDGTGGGASSSEVASARQFTKRISDFLKPSNNLFAKVELKSRQRARSLARVGCLFCDLLVRARYL